MIINLIKETQIFMLTLPHKIKGQYWLRDTDIQGRKRDLISIEAVNGDWIVKSNPLVSILNPDGTSVSNTVLKPGNFFLLKIAGHDERVVLFSEARDQSRQIFKKYLIEDALVLNIGRSSNQDLCYENKFVSGAHASLSYDGECWKIMDMGSTNGTYVNGYRINEEKLFPGDLVYIMGLQIVIGHQFLAMNDPDHLLKIQTQGLIDYVPQQIKKRPTQTVLPVREYFFRSPRFYRKIEHALIKIDTPPQPQKVDTVPLSLMLGPSITMGMTSAGTGLLSLSNVMASGGNVMQAMPTVLMSFSMLLGTVLWPILTKRYEKKQKLKNERKRQEKYLAYLDRTRDEIKRICKEQSDILEENLISPDVCGERIAETSVKLWERVIGQPDFLTLRIGRGDATLDGEVEYQKKQFVMEEDNLQDAMYALGAEPKELHDVPISVSLTDHTTVGIYGNDTQRKRLLKSLILQMIALHSYDELKLMLITDESESGEWDFIRPIPHFWSDDKTVRFFAVDLDEIKELSAYIEKNIIVRADRVNRASMSDTPYYVILCADKTLGEKCEGLRQLLKLKQDCSCSVVFAASQLRDLPKETKLILATETGGCRMFDREDTSGKAIPFVPDTLNEDRLGELAQNVSNIELDISSYRYSMPTMLTFLEMFHVGKIDHLNSLTRWKENNPTITLQTPIGVDAHGEIFMLDLHERFHGPHGLIAGMTGSGKSEFIITYILSLAVNYHPDEVSFILIDYKGGGLAGAFEDPQRGIRLPHLAGTITNLDGAAVNRSLISIQSELRRRQKIFNEARKISNEGTMDIYKYQQLYRDKVVDEPIPHLFIISDEFAELKTQQPEFMEQLISAARIGRSLGIHLILATQKPSGVVDDQIWSNSRFRVCLKVQEKADSQEVIKCPDAAEISQTGRFYLQVGFNELFAYGQSAWCGADYVPGETVEKKVDHSIQVVDNLGRVMMNAKTTGQRQTKGNRIKQIIAVVQYLSNLAKEEHISVRSLWLDPIPAFIYVDELEKKYQTTTKPFLLDPVVGEYDDPFNQRQGVLTIPFSKDGNCLIYGSNGNGKTTLLTTLAYSLIRHHTARELNLYIMDFGSETLKVFEQAPQVGEVMVSADEEKIMNFLKMLQEEIESRKTVFSAYGGDFENYCRSGSDPLANIVVLLNNYSGFCEQFEDQQELFTQLTREGAKYGIYFALTASTTNAVRYKTQQNFKIMLTMQLNDASDYSIIVGKHDGLVPSRYKGRGLVALDRVYEFQSAHCCRTQDQQAYLREYCRNLRENADVYARAVPMLPDHVTYDLLRPAFTDLKSVPIGIKTEDQNIAALPLRSRVLFPVIAQDLSDLAPFTEAFTRLLSDVCNVTLWDSDKRLSHLQGSVIQKNFESEVISLFQDMVMRNNSYKDSGMDAAILENFDEKVFVIYGTKRLFEQLSEDGKEKFTLLIEKAESQYRIHFVLIDTISQYTGFCYSSWFKQHVNGSEGVWIGDGIANQNLLNISRLTAEMYDEIGNEHGWMVMKNRPQLVKLLTTQEMKEG